MDCNNLPPNQKNKRRFKETDKSKDFKESGMTLITEPESDKYLKRTTKNNPPKD